LNFSFTEPYFLDQDLSAGVDAYRTETDRTSDTTFKERNLGGGFRFGWDWSEFLRQNVRYNLSDDEIFDIKATSSNAIRVQKGSELSSVVSQELTYDRRDSKISPTDGYVIKIANDVSGAGGDTRYLRTRVNVGYYRPIGEDLVASVTGEGGYIFGFNQDVRITDAFFLGGANLRGFRSRGVGPRDTTTGDFLGGNKYFAGSVQLSFPLGLPEEYKIRGRAFSDFGTLFGNDFEDRAASFTDKASIRASVGAGITWDSPFGPFAFDLAYPFLKEGTDKEEFFRFSVGTRF
jgi:outer membrane protein insertion porin family